MLTPDVLKRIVNFRVNDLTQQRIDELADKCNDGTLTPEEHVEYESYVSFFNWMTLIQVKARTHLKNRPDESI